jgi:hypothetical protein
VTLRRYTALTYVPQASLIAERRQFRMLVLERDNYQCVGKLLGFPGECFGALEADHIRASGALSVKSVSHPDNGASLCSLHHRWKTVNGREARPKLVAYVERLKAQNGA